jgi:hypothetical protein
VPVRPGLTQSLPPRDRCPLRSDTVFYRIKSPGKARRSNTYPTNSPCDLFIERVLSVLPDASEIIGPPRKSWWSFSITAWRYPAGSGMALHTDGESSYSGGYIYFFHTKWRLHWGGNLLVLDPATPHQTGGRQGGEDLLRPIRAWLDDDLEDSNLWNPGIGLCILPKPNRLVFIAPDALHMVSKIVPDVEDVVRDSIIGFFSKA